MSWTNWIVGIQCVTFLTLAFGFTFTGSWRLGIAQASYAIATAVLFLRK